MYFILTVLGFNSVYLLMLVKNLKRYNKNNKAQLFILGFTNLQIKEAYY